MFGIESIRDQYKYPVLRYIHIYLVKTHRDDTTVYKCAIWFFFISLCSRSDLISREHLAVGCIHNCYMYMYIYCVWRAHKTCN